MRAVFISPNARLHKPLGELQSGMNNGISMILDGFRSGKTLEPTGFCLFVL